MILKICLELLTRENLKFFKEYLAIQENPLFSEILTNQILLEQIYKGLNWDYIFSLFNLQMRHYLWQQFNDENKKQQGEK